MKHTPGPWTIEYHSVQDGKGGDKYAWIHSKKWRICKVAQWSEEQQGDAHLIAAAPDLLEACKEALGSETSKDCYADHHGYCQAHNLDPIEKCWVKLCEQAIVKAEGK